MRFNLTRDLQRSAAFVRDGKRLALLDNIERCNRALKRATERRQARMKLRTQFDAVQHNGVVGVIVWSRDCDCTEATYSRTVEVSTLADYCAWMDEQMAWADGPMSFTLVPVAEAQAFECSTRDRALEAFEDGHAHAIY